jgi:hypothetical protein
MALYSDIFCIVIFVLFHAILIALDSSGLPINHPRNHHTAEKQDHDGEN